MGIFLVKRAFKIKEVHLSWVKERCKEIHALGSGCRKSGDK